MPSILGQYAAVLAFALFAIAFVVVTSLASKLIRPYLPNAIKSAPYECGEAPIGDSFVQFDIRFYTIALIFLIFDVEVVFLFPWAVVFKKLLANPEFGIMVLFEMLVFVSILLVGYVYLWKKGDLDWNLGIRK
jgi:NADH-quinone oxidoreductase subunit A